MNTQCPHCGKSYFDLPNDYEEQSVNCAICQNDFIAIRIDNIPTKPTRAAVNRNEIKKASRQKINARRAAGNFASYYPQTAQNKKIINCPVCGREVSKNAPTCPQCGEKISIGKCRNAKIGFFFFFLILVFIVVLIIIGNSKADSTDFVKMVFSTCIIGSIICIAAMAVCFTSPSGR